MALMAFPRGDVVTEPRCLLSRHWKVALCRPEQQTKTMAVIIGHKVRVCSTGAVVSK